jgi:hypothetical protein
MKKVRPRAPRPDITIISWERLPPETKRKLLDAHKATGATGTIKVKLGLKEIAAIYGDDATACFKEILTDFAALRAKVAKLPPELWPILNQTPLIVPAKRRRRRGITPEKAAEIVRLRLEKDASATMSQCRADAAAAGYAGYREHVDKAYRRFHEQRGISIKPRGRRKRARNG